MFLLTKALFCLPPTEEQTCAAAEHETSSDSAMGTHTPLPLGRVGCPTNADQFHTQAICRIIFWQLLPGFRAFSSVCLSDYTSYFPERI